MSSNYSSARWHEWAVNVWEQKRNELIKEGKLGGDLMFTTLYCFFKAIKIIKQRKRKWLKKSETKLSELQIKMGNKGYSENEIDEELSNLQEGLIEEMDEIFDDYIDMKRKFVCKEKNIGGQNG